MVGSGRTINRWIAVIAEIGLRALGRVSIAHAISRSAKENAPDLPMTAMTCDHGDPGDPKGPMATAPNQTTIHKAATIMLIAAALFFAAQGSGDKARAQQKQNSRSSPAAGPAREARHDHVGKPLPDYMTGDQCLFCHRNVVGPTWEKEPHAWTVRELGVAPSVPSQPKDATHIIGSAQHYRALKLISYGKFSILANDGKTWLTDVFATQCAGCHTTGVDPSTHAFSGYAFDCYACHGDTPEAHATKPELAWLGSKRPQEPRAIVAICGQCHLRGGRSQSTGLPYPNNFVAGDDLFADFKVDLSREYDKTMNPADRHAYTYTRNVLERGSKQTCLDCHRVHGRPELKEVYCIDCDDAPGKAAGASKLRSETCQY